MNAIPQSKLVHSLLIRLDVAHLAAVCAFSACDAGFLGKRGWRRGRRRRCRRATLQNTFLLVTGEGAFSVSFESSELFLESKNNNQYRACLWLPLYTYRFCARLSCSASPVGLSSDNLLKSVRSNG